jgi:hypothetical protein
MNPAFLPLAARVKPLGNPARRYLRTVERHGECLLARLEASGRLSHIHLDRTAPALAEDFERVAAAGRETEEKLVLLGTFYAVQLLHQNARALEQLAVDLAEKPDRSGAYAAFVERTAEEFSLLVRTYAGLVLRLLRTDETGPFVVLNVGTPSHQDDIDAAVVAGEGASRAEIDRVVARLSGQLLRYASPLDNYVAQEVGAEGFCVAVEEVGRALRSGRLGFVVVTELLRAQPLVGETAVLDRLREEVMAEYFLRPGRDNSRHELYLRGLLGETRALLLRPPPPDRVDPKDDGLRLILGLATAFKTIEGLPATDPGEILTRVMARRPELRAPLGRLEESRVFLETFRQAAQLLIAEGEEIAVEGEAARENLGLVAAALGYKDWGPVRAVDLLLVHYHEAIEAARGAALSLMEHVARHLTEISRFARWTRGPSPDDLASELAGALVQASRAFRGVRFYDDLLEAFAAPGGARLGAFLRSYRRLSAEERRELARLYAEWGHDAPYTLLSLLTLLSRQRGADEGIDPVDEIAEAFLQRLSGSPEAVRALSRVFRSYPELTNRLLFALRRARLLRLESVIDVPIGNPEVAAARDAFRDLVRVHRESSRYIKRVLGRVTERHPATVQAMSDDARLRTLALGRLAASERHPSPETQKRLLGDFYDIEFLRVAMGTLRGEPVARTRDAFADLTATYLGRLLDFCFRQVEQETGGWTTERDRIGILLSGGNARRRPYDEDYDLLVLLDSEDLAARTFAERVVVLMNAHIAQRGVITQYHLGEHLGRFVTTLDELVELLGGSDDELFVDRCQLLGSRLIVGSRRVRERLLARVLQPLVFARAEAFAARVAREIADRRRALAPPDPGTLHLKESPGGLREIDLVLVVEKARHGVWDGEEDPFAELAERDPDRAEAYLDLAAADAFLVAVRSAHRVAVAATDEVEERQLAAPARVLGYEPGAEARLFADIEGRLARSATLVDRLSAAAGVGVRGA